ncbi:MAG: hypothetical protein RLY40_712 [Pseudomonadota bacterium]
MQKEPFQEMRKTVIKADPFYSRSKVNDQTGQLVSQADYDGHLVYNLLGDCDQRAMSPLHDFKVHLAFSARTENSSGSNPFGEDGRDSRQFAVLKNFDPKRGDLIYGLKTQQTSCIKELFKDYEHNERCLRATINEYTDPIVKAITETNSKIAATSATMANIAADIIAAEVVDIAPLKPYIYRNFCSCISGYTKYIERNYDNYNYVEPISKYCDQIIERITTTIKMIQSDRVSQTMQSLIKTLKSDVKNIVINALIAQNASITFPKQHYKNLFLTLSFFNKYRNFLWEEFFTIAEKNKKFDIVEIYKETIQNYKKRSYSQMLCMQSY